MAKKKARSRRKADPRNERLKEIMEEYQLTRREVRAYTKYATSQIDAWLLPPESPHYRHMRESALRLLELELEIEKPIGPPEFEHEVCA